MDKRSGFTLVELSIVLVIIGLIVGGVLVGRDMIESAQNRSIITQLESYRAAANTFKQKYNCVPGDCATATNFGLGANGNGNTTIGETSAESFNFWVHLASANLVAGNFDGATFTPGVGFPRTKLTASVWIFSFATPSLAASPYFNSPRNLFVLSDPSGSFAGTVTYAAGLKPSTAFYIDTKMDDGLYNQGRVKTASSYVSSGGNYPDINSITGGNGGTACFDMANNYNVTLGALSCVMNFNILDF